MKSSTVTAQFPYDCKTVWDIVTDNKNFAWRSDLSRIEVIDENRFDEYTKEGFVTHFYITAKDPCHEYRFTMENKNMRGNWSGIFESCDDGTMIVFTEVVQVNNPIMNLFVKGYLKKQQAAYIADLRNALERCYADSIFGRFLLTADAKININIGIIAERTKNNEK